MMKTAIAKTLQKQMDKDPEIRSFVESVEERLAPLTREQMGSSGFHFEKKHTRKNREVWTIKVNAGDRIWCKPEDAGLLLMEFFQHDAMLRFLRNGSEEDILVEAINRVQK